MTMVTKEEIRQLGGLARLSLSESEIGDLEHDLSRILDYMENLSEVDTRKVAAMTHVGQGQTTGLRSDSPEPSLALAAVLAQTPFVEEDCFSVPPVLPTGSAK